MPNVQRSLTWNAAERANDAAFNKKYGVAIFEQYKMVSDAELNDMDDADADDEWMVDEEDTVMGETPTRGNTIAPEAISLSRSALTAHLSASASDSTFSESNTNLSQSTLEHSGHFSGSETDTSQVYVPINTLSATNSIQGP